MALHNTSDVITLIKSRRFLWHVACIMEIGKCGVSKRRRKDNGISFNFDIVLKRRQDKKYKHNVAFRSFEMFES